MAKATLQNLSKLLNAYRKDHQVNISRKDGITHIRVMSDDYVSMLECASNTGGDDYEELAIESIAITRDEITGDKQDKKLLIARLPEMSNHKINFNADSKIFSSSLKKHAGIANGMNKNGNPYSKTTFNINGGILDLFTLNEDVGIKESHVSEINIPPTEELGGVMYDAIKLHDTLFKYVTPDEINIRIVKELYPIEVMFNVDCYQCHYIQAPMIDN